MNAEKQQKILVAARAVFLRHGYRRVSMNDIAEASGVSRPALYLAFRNKEAIFIAVLAQWIEATIADVEAEIAAHTGPADQIAAAFEIWTVRPFEAMQTSPEVRAFVECSFDFAQPALRQGYALFEASITPVIASLAAGGAGPPPVTPAAAAQVLASASRGFKQTATTPADLRRLIADLLALAFGAPACPTNP